MTHARGFDVSVIKLIIKKISSGEEFCLVGCDDKVGTLLLDLTIEESILSPSIVGNLTVKELGDFMDKFIVTGTDETIYIEVENPTIPNSNHKLEFCINDIHKDGNAATSDAAYGGPSKYIKWKIHFVSCEPLYLDMPDWQEKAGFMDEDRFLKIAEGNIGGGDGESKAVTGAVTDGGEPEGEGLKDLVTELANKYFNPGATEYSKAQKPMEIEGTHNSIWLKSHPNLYPWGKATTPMSLMNTMSNLAENAVAEDMVHCNFHFWADWDGYHFKSVNQMIEDTDVPKSSEGHPDISQPYVYQKSDGVTPLKYQESKGDPKILSQKESVGYDHLGFWQDGMYSTYYYNIEPDYSDPYTDYLDTSSQYPSKLVDYDYHRDWPDWNSIEEFKIIADDIETDIDKYNPQKNRLYRHDSEIFGYFSPYLNDPNPKPYDFIASRLNQGRYGRDNTIYWQTQSDAIDVPMTDLKKLYEKIIKPSEENYKEFLRIKNLKEKWNVYRHSICCDKQDIKKQFLAVIEDAVLVSDDGGTPNRGGIYEYSWREVEIWPTAAVNELCQTEDGEDAEILSNEEAPLSVVVVPGGLEGKHFMAGSDAAAEGGGEAPTLGGWTNGAYNINELLNVKDGDDVYVGPGVNVADDDFNDYPEAYQMMPVGGFFKVGEDPCADDHEETIHFHKHVVQMYRLPAYMLECIVPAESESEGSTDDTGGGLTDDPDGGEGGAEGEPENLGPEEIFFFDVPNAHDGLCGCIE